MMNTENEKPDRANCRFTVVVEGELPETAVSKLNDAIQRAALTEIAALDLRGSELTFRPVMADLLMAGGGTGGGFIISLRKPDTE